MYQMRKQKNNYVKGLICLKQLISTNNSYMYRCFNVLQWHCHHHYLRILEHIDTCIPVTFYNLLSVHIYIACTCRLKQNTYYFVCFAIAIIPLYIVKYFVTALLSFCFNINFLLQTIVSDCSFLASLAISAAYERNFKRSLITRYQHNRCCKRKTWGIKLYCLNFVQKMCFLPIRKVLTFALVKYGFGISQAFLHFYSFYHYMQFDAKGLPPSF